MHILAVFAGGALVVTMVIVGAYFAGKNSCAISNLEYNAYIQKIIREKSDKEAESIQKIKRDLHTKIKEAENAEASNVDGCISSEQLRIIREIAN